jgi:hypothetical protein
MTTGGSDGRNKFRFLVVLGADVVEVELVVILDVRDSGLRRVVI